MTVSTTTSRADYTGNGVTTAFAVPFYFLDDAHLTVLRTQISTGVITTLAITTNYTVSGAGVPAGGTVTCVVAPTADQKISILRNVPLTQLNSYVPNDPFPAASHERALDKLTMEVQQLDEAQDRALTLPANTAAGTVSTELPTPAANQVIGWNSTATGLQNVNAQTLATVTAYGSQFVDVFSGNGVQTQFTLSQNPGTISNLLVSISGVAQRPTIDYTYPGGAVINFVAAPASGTNNIMVRYGSVVSTGAPSKDAQTFDTVAIVNSATIDASVNHIRTARYTTAWSGGGATYVRKLTNQVAQPNPANRELIYSLNGSNYDHWELVGDSVNVLQLGADPTGLTASHVAFQAAINYLVSPPANRFAHIEVPSGNYLFTTGVTIPDGRRIKIEGLGDARIFTASTINLFSHTRGATASFSTVHFENIWFESTAGGAPASGLRAIKWTGQDSAGTLYKNSNVHVFNCEFRNFWRAVDLIYAEGCTFRRCYGANNTTDFNLERWASFLEINGYTTTGGTYFVYADDRITGVYSGGLSNTLWITNCLSTFKENDIVMRGWDAVNITNGGSDLGGTSAGAGQAAIYLEKTTNVNITNHYISSATTGTPNPRDNRVGLELVNCQVVKVIGNKIVDNAIGIRATNSPAADLTLFAQNNNFRNNRLSHVTAVGCSKGIVSGNAFDNTPPRTVKNFEVWLNETGTSQWVVSGNVFAGASYDIATAGNSTVVDNIWSSANIPLILRANDTNRLWITAAGKVGVNSPTPNGDFEVSATAANNTGHIVVYSTDDPCLTLINTGVQAWSAWVDASDGSAFKIGGSNAGLSSAVPYLTITAGAGAGRVTANAPEGLGYGTGAGGSVTQTTSRSTGVTINAACGSITLVSAAGSTTETTFTVTNSKVAATDTVIVSQRSGTDRYIVSASAVAAGSFNITFRTFSGTTTEQPVFNFAVIKAVTA